MKTNFILIDLENVQPPQLDRLHGLAVEIRVFLGPHQSKLPVELVASLQPFGKAVQYVQLAGNGKNALDFHIAFHLGRLAAEYPSGYFHIISKDTGFDPLVVHLRSLGLFCQRSKAVDEIPFLKLQERIAGAKALLAGPQSARPATLAKLHNAIRTRFGKTLTEAEANAIVNALKAAKAIAEDAGGKLSYPAGCAGGTPA